MDWPKSLKVIANTIYSVGVIIVLCLGAVSLFGPNKAINPMAMIPLTWKEQAFLWLAFGTIPMLLACMSVYKFNAIKNAKRKARNVILIFLPGLICTACALYVVGVVVVGMVNTFLH